MFIKTNDLILTLSTLTKERSQRGRKQKPSVNSSEQPEGSHFDLFSYNFSRQLFFRKKNTKISHGVG